MSFIDYLRETKGELKHVTWPSKSQTMVFTALVIALSVIVAYFLGAFDFLFRLGLEQLFVR
ncbi:preprotein translocase subunit SecE [Candidatus Parcubacteria bacterium]|nr:preprotein translocase subunit SecE [Candidatus Parcubacteria bacterium]